ncbi:hypothetical protein HMSSN139_53670 [Paenibacillus sp. HMSSN-139]|nr:hypothetical protein HMSSN139_53670 [Paenibacillus sp. HMSSN-139]
MHSGMHSRWMENTENSGSGQAELLRKLKDKTAVIGVIGLGYVGLPLAVEKAKAGYRVIGFDVQSRKIEMLNRGHNYIGDVVDEDLRGMVKDGRLRATAEYAFLSEVDAVAICVPTPLDIYQQPDTSYVENSTREIARFLHPGDAGRAGKHHVSRDGRRNWCGRSSRQRGCVAALIFPGVFPGAGGPRQ